MSFNKHSLSRIGRQRGFNLVGLMVGSTISLIGILGCMTMFQSLAQNTVEMKTDAQHDGLLASTMLALQLELQSAGFDSADATTDNIVVDNSTAGQPKIYWRYKDDAGNYLCKGLDVRTSNDATIDRLGVWVEESANCTKDTDLSAATWVDDGVVAMFRNNPSITVTSSDVACWPYGRMAVAAGTTYRQINIIANSAARTLNGQGVGQHSYSFCLPNIVVSS